MPFNVEDEFHVAIVTPVVHYSMGGVQINAAAEIVRPSKEAGKFGEPISGLFAAGEVAGGVHGKNRLGGSGLLGCVVYGRVAGDSAAKFLLQSITAQNANRRLGGVMQQLAPGSFSITVNPSQNSFTVQLGGAASGAEAAPSSAASAAAPVSAPGAAAAIPAPAALGAKKEYTYEEVAKHNTEKDCWCVVNGDVLDVTKFLDVHPGGRHAILLFAGKEARSVRAEIKQHSDGCTLSPRTALQLTHAHSCPLCLCVCLCVQRRVQHDSQGRRGGQVRSRDHHRNHQEVKE